MIDGRDVAKDGGFPAARDRAEGIGIRVHAADGIHLANVLAGADAPERLGAGLDEVRAVLDHADFVAAREEEFELEALAIDPGDRIELRSAGDEGLGLGDEIGFIGKILDEFLERGRGLLVESLLEIALAEAEFGLGGERIAGLGLDDQLLVDGDGGIDVALGVLVVDALLEEFSDGGGRGCGRGVGAGGRWRESEEGGQEQACHEMGWSRFHAGQDRRGLLPVCYPDVLKEGHFWGGGGGGKPSSRNYPSHRQRAVGVAIPHFRTLPDTC